MMEASDRLQQQSLGQRFTNGSPVSQQSHQFSAEHLQQQQVAGPSSSSPFSAAPSPFITTSTNNFNCPPGGEVKKIQQQQQPQLSSSSLFLNNSHIAAFLTAARQQFPPPIHADTFSIASVDSDNTVLLNGGGNGGGCLANLLQLQLQQFLRSHSNNSSPTDAAIISSSNNSGLLLTSSARSSSSSHLSAEIIHPQQQQKEHQAFSSLDLKTGVDGNAICPVCGGTAGPFNSAKWSEHLKTERNNFFAVLESLKNINRTPSSRMASKIKTWESNLARIKSRISRDSPYKLKRPPSQSSTTNFWPSSRTDITTKNPSEGNESKNNFSKVNAREQQTTLMKMANETIITPPSSGGSTSGETNFKTLDSLQMNGKHPNSSQPINNNKSYRIDFLTKTHVDSDKPFVNGLSITYDDVTTSSQCRTNIAKKNSPTDSCEHGESVYDNLAVENSDNNCNVNGVDQLLKTVHDFTQKRSPFRRSSGLN